jgi:2-polyprenyl-3-methyl-5-hydroxy-6-metoxy-1,4-benzoquinol methylase
MSALAARFFTRVQAAGFYRTLLSDAVALLPAGSGRSLLDVGCGPGLLTRLAAARGYDAVGLDADGAMIAAARRLAAEEGSAATFVHARFPDRLVPRADVVAAASLLAVAPEREKTLRSLWQRTEPGGTLLIVEATERLSLRSANAAVASGLPPPGRSLLRVWAAARGGSTVDPRLRDSIPEAACRTVPLLGGLAEAWLFSARG